MYWYVDDHCVSISKMSSAVNKSLKWHFCRIILYSIIIVLDLSSRKLSYYFQLPNEHITWCIDNLGACIVPSLVRMAIIFKPWNLYRVATKQSIYPSQCLDMTICVCVCARACVCPHSRVVILLHEKWKYMENLVNLTSYDVYILNSWYAFATG